MQSLSAGSATRTESSHSHRSARARSWLNSIPNGRAAAVLAAELLAAAAAYAIAAFATVPRFEDALSIISETAAIALTFRLAALLSSRLYRRSIRFATAPDLTCIAKAVLAAELPLAAFALWQFPMLHLSTGFFVVDAAFLLLAWSALHFGFRVARAHRSALNKSGRKALIIGAGDAGIMLLKEIAADAASTFQPVAILDDDPSKWGRTIAGLPVRGGTADLATIAAQAKAEEALICIPSATREQMRSILDACRRVDLPIRTLPPLSELLRHGASERHLATVSRRDLRPPRIEDLLDRDVIRVDIAETRKLVENEVVLITGAGGSIGSELARQVAAAHPRKLLLLDKSESGLFYANMEAREKLGVAAVMPILADVLDRDRLRHLFHSERPSLVFHAAAYKHVAMMDLYPREAIRNNVIGTHYVAHAALEFGARRFVNISTDKAVNPRNWMGLSKKLTELCIEEFSSAAATRFSNVRFGNVAGSSGSVLRLFWDRIERREPIRVTDPRATRFFMSIPEAVHLILRSAAIGCGGETFVLDMGEPVNICELARTMMLYSGLQPGRDLQIEFTGLQPGEKVDEELWEKNEHPVVSGSDHVLVIRDRHPLACGIGKRICRMDKLLECGGESDVFDDLYSIFPDFRWNRRQFESKSMPIAEPAMARSAGAA